MCDERETGGSMRRAIEVGVDGEGDSRKIGEGKEGGLTLLPWGFSSGGLSCGLLRLSAVAGWRVGNRFISSDGAKRRGGGRK